MQTYIYVRSGRFISETWKSKERPAPLTCGGGTVIGAGTGIGGTGTGKGLGMGDTGSACELSAPPF